MRSQLSPAAVCLMFFILACGSGIQDNTKDGQNKKRIKTFTTEMYPDCWINHQTLQQKIVLSGPYASRVGKPNPYSYGYRERLGDIDSLLPRRVMIGFWVFYPIKGISTDLVVSVDSLEKNRFWAGVSLKDSINKASEWQQINCKLTLPRRKLRPDDKISIYLWNKDSTAVFMDDLMVTFEY
jgi:hypothetical protein